MKNLIVFMSHHGTTARVAGQLASSPGEEDTLLAILIRTR